MLDEARQRLEQGLPPTDSCEMEWDRMERNKIRRHQEIVSHSNLRS